MSNCTQPDDIKKYSAEYYPFIFVCLFLSLGGSVLITFTYFFSKSLHRHPLSIVFRISLFQCFSTVALGINYVYAFFSIDDNQDSHNFDLKTGFESIVWLLATMGDFAALLFHALLSINLILSTMRPFADGSSLKILYKPIYAFSFLYPIIRMTLWRYYWYSQHNDCQMDTYMYFRKSQFPYEAAIGITAIFLIAVAALLFAVIGIKSLPQKVYQCKKTIIRQTAFYVVAYLVCWSGPLVFRLGYVSKELDSNLLFKLRTWSDFSELLVGFVTSLVWLTLPSIAQMLKSYCCCCLNSAPEEEFHSLLKEDEDDFSSLNLLLRKNFLICTLNGLRHVLKSEYSVQGKSVQAPSPQPEHLANEAERPYIVSSSASDSTDKDLVPESFLMTALSPRAYSVIQRLSGFDTPSYYESLEPDTFLASALKNQKFSEGRSGAFFVFSPNKKFILKTISRAEYQSLLHLTPQYYRHLKRYPNSLLMRILGGYKISLFHTQIYVIVMENLFHNFNIKEVYDLKGSWVERTGAIGSSVKKDLDLKDNFFEIGKSIADTILAQLKLDAESLGSHNIVDYSLLVGIEFVDGTTEHIIKRKSKNSLRVQHSMDERVIFVFGMIDMLQSYNIPKKIEHIVKTCLLCKDKDGISIVPPQTYQTRFFTFLSTKIQ